MSSSGFSDLIIGDVWMFAGHSGTRSRVFNCRIEKRHAISAACGFASNAGKGLSAIQARGWRGAGYMFAIIGIVVALGAILAVS